MTEETIDYFESLPLDVKLEVLKYSPSFTSTSQQYQSKGKFLFYQQHCNNPISNAEFFNHLRVKDPKSFAIYTAEGDEYYAYVFTALNDRYYKIKQIVLFTKKYDNEHLITMVSNERIQDFDWIYEKFKSKPILYYDIISIYNIAKRRLSCATPLMTVKVYAKNYMEKQLDEILAPKHVDNDMEVMLNQVKNIIYVVTNHMVMTGVDVNHNFYILLPNVLGNVRFDDEDNTNDDIESALFQLDKIYNTYLKHVEEFIENI